jgi:hypothetical protein
MPVLKGRSARYAVPVVVLLGVAAAYGAPELSGASAPPSLPSVPVQQLVADIAQAKAPALSGTLTWTANLGLSGLQSLENELGGSQASTSGGFNPLSLLSGSYTLNVWLDGTKAQHLALITGQGSEIDLISGEGQAWVWDSTNQSVLHLLAPSGPASTVMPAQGTLPTPQQLAANVLSAVSPSTSVSVGSPVWVAGQPAYQLVLAPKDAPGSTVRQVNIAVGADGALAGVPLQVAVYADSLTAPALQLGFTGGITLGPPPASELSFTPPPGSTVTTRTLRAQGGEPFSGSGWQAVTSTNSGWATVFEGTSPALAGTGAEAQVAPFTSQVEVRGQPARLFSTDLLNALLMPNGRFYAGFVTPSTLEAVAG